MTGQTSIYQFPYLTGTDGGKQIKTVSKALAERIEATMENQGITPLDSDLVALLTRLADLEVRVGALPDPDDTGWNNLPLSNGWASFGSPYVTPRYRRYNGVVYIEGLVTGGATALDTQIAALPDGFRPSGQIMVGAPNNGAMAALKVTATGRILVGSAISSSWVSLTVAYLVAS